MKIAKHNAKAMLKTTGKMTKGEFNKSTLDIQDIVFINAKTQKKICLQRNICT